MRTTLDLDDTLMRRAKAAAAEQGITLTALMNRALRDALDELSGEASFRLDIPIVEGSGLPRVDITDRDALFDAT
ncbi:hypothetical protein [Salsipaludibacter albus]|uniref:hypothetical protein n=1 Tax=Salsipaludibacter albus TaxID=2849650 RepID=UPI001EE45CA6|nr:hypothetical protein [Salsipaludibacter albus]MBY5163461.1 hypothetical protein [Salsipaludibacter albus]